MCGMGGFIGDKVADSDLILMRNIGLLNMFRGEHSTGMFDVTPGQKVPVKYHKRAVDSVSFIASNYYNAWNTRWKDSKPVALAYHCRHATQGKVSSENAHPFHKGNVIGMHNGTIFSKFTNRNDFDTDSETIFHNIDTLGLEKTLSELSEKDPAYALVWYDLKKRTMNIIRNEKRPLHYSWMLGTFFWSSERRHLEMAYEGAGYKATPVINAFEPFHLYSFDLQEKNFTTYKKRKIEEAVEPMYTTSKSYSTYSPKVRSISELVVMGKTEHELKHWQSHAYNNWDEKTDKWYTDWAFDELKKAREAEEEKSNVVPFKADDLPFEKAEEKSGGKSGRRFLVGPGLMSEATESAYRAKLKQGCQCCGEKTGFDDAVFWVNNSDYLCLDCTENLVTDNKHWIRHNMFYTDEQLAQLEKDYYTHVENENKGVGAIIN
jgi:hypothetical protein